MGGDRMTTSIPASMILSKDSRALLPLRAAETPDYAEILAVDGERVALSVRPDLILALNAMPSLIDAAASLLLASLADYGEPEGYAEDEGVAAGADGDSAVTFGHLRRLRGALDGHAVGHPAGVWFLIASAPVDGTVFVASDHKRRYRSLGYFNAVSEFEEVDREGRPTACGFYPTHWAPLPPLCDTAPDQPPSEAKA